MVLHVPHELRMATTKSWSEQLTQMLLSSLSQLSTICSQKMNCGLYLELEKGCDACMEAPDLAAGLGPDNAQALTMFHSLTRWNTVSSFASHIWKTTWAVWNVLPQLTEALLKLSSAPCEIPEAVLHIIEMLVILMYDRTSPCTDIDKARKKLFARKYNVELIPPAAKAALEEHVKRADYQGGHVQGQVLVPSPEQPAATSWGWIKTEGGLHLHWTRLPKAAQSCHELLSCKCKTGCVKRCKCKKVALECTALCLCEG